MTPPTDEEKLAGLAALAGQRQQQVMPPDVLGRAMLTLRLVGEAKARGASWAQLAPHVGADSGQAAKAAVKRLARKAQAAVIQRDTEERGAR